MTDRRLLAALATYWALVQAGACLGSLAGGYFIQWPSGRLVMGAAYGLAEMTLLASSSYVAFGCNRLRVRLAIHLVTYFASVAVTWAAAKLMAFGILAGLPADADMSFPTGLDLAALIAAGSIPSFTIIAGVLYCLQPLFGLVAVGPAPKRLFTTRSILAATTAIAIGLGAAASIRQTPNSPTDFLWLGRNVLIAVSALLSALGRRPLTGLVLLGVALPLPLLSLWDGARGWTRASEDWPMFLAWGSASWVSLCGLLLILRRRGYRLLRGTTEWCWPLATQRLSRRPT